MALFSYILILLLAVLLSNIVNRFLPFIAVPVVQIGLGIIIALLPLQYDLVLDPELFFILFVAPLVYYATMHTDKSALWSMKGIVISTALLLVLITTFSIGYLIHLIIPAIPVAAAFTLIASLGPTDDVAVASVGKRYKVPGKMMELLQSESTLNDVSALICFQIGISIVIQGSFSVSQAVGQFFAVAAGGILVGLAFMLGTFFLVIWLKSLGIENVTIHVLVGILSPFLIYYIAESLAVSGIIAVFVGGIVCSFQRAQINPDTVDIKITSDNIWSVTAFALEGIVFILLGTQFPEILHSLLYNNHTVSTEMILLVVLFLSLSLALIRFLWAFFIIPKSTYNDGGAHNIGKIKASLVFSLSGARGAVTLASIFSIPLLLDNGELFPQRDLMLVLSMGVIICSIIMTYFILPLLIGKKEEDQGSGSEIEASIQILQNVIKELNKQASEENKNAVNIVTHNYISRIMSLENKHHESKENMTEEYNLYLKIADWKKEYVDKLIKERRVNLETASFYMQFLQHEMKETAVKNKKRFAYISGNFIGRGFGRNAKNKAIQQEELLKLIKYTENYILEELYKLEKLDDLDIIQQMISEYEVSLQIKEHSVYSGSEAGEKVSEGSILDTTLLGLQLEKDYIQIMFEKGKLSREKSKIMRQNVALMETQLIN